VVPVTTVLHANLRISIFSRRRHALIDTLLRIVHPNDRGFRYIFIRSAERVLRTTVIVPNGRDWHCAKPNLKRDGRT